MMKIDYKIERNEEDRITTFSPNEQLLEIPNLAFVEGPNSSGKSTILHLLALAFNGLKNELVSNSLKEKMKALLDDSYQKLEFDIKIDTNDGLLEIIRKPENSNIRAYLSTDNNKKENLSTDVLMRRYNLIYDIPEDPTARLSQLTQAIDHNQKMLKERIRVLKEHTRSQLSSLEQSRNDEAIALLDEKIRNNITLNEEQTKKNARNINENELLKKYIYLKDTLKKFSDLEKANKELDEHKKLEKKIAGSRAPKYATVAYKRAKAIVSSIEATSTDVIERLNSIYADEFEEITEWDRYSFNSAMTTYSISKAVVDIIKDIKTKLINKKRKLEENKAEFEKGELIDEIIKVLKHYEKKGLIIPGVNKSIEEFLSILENEQKPFISGSKELEMVDDLLDNVKEILEDIGNLNNIYLKDLCQEQSKHIDESYGISMEEYQNRLMELTEKAAKIQRAFDNNKAECIRLGVDIENVEQKNEIFNQIALRTDGMNIKITSLENLQTMIQSIDEQIRLDTHAIKRREEVIFRDSTALDEMKKREVHKYTGKEKELENIIRGCDALLVKINKYSEYLSRINKRESIEDEDFLRYNELIGYYLGDMLGEVTHIDGRYKLKKVNILKQELHTEGGRIIRFSDMGTGQSQSTYLLGRLSNASSDPRKIIVLFDEIAMMDNKSLMPIRDKMIELKNQGKLIAGIMVQRNDSGISVREIVG